MTRKKKKKSNLTSIESRTLNKLKWNELLYFFISHIVLFRKQIHALSYVHQTDLKIIRNLLTDFKCIGCKEQQKDTSTPSLPPPQPSPSSNHANESESNAVTFKPIGIVRSDFPEKRAVPRQPSVCLKLPGYIELSKDVFNNPEHSLDRLSEFSHLWIIYHFHKNESHAKAKVAPPRLGGERVGIFSTRSPHRPCPIGLSLVEIDRIEACRIYFHGTDMVDGTPVLDLKPYIPRYDSPVRNRFTGIYNSISGSGIQLFNLFIIFSFIPDNQSISTEDESQTFDTREEPDGEETIARSIAANAQTSIASPGSASAIVGHDSVKVPNWILSDTTLEVVFNDRATSQIDEFQINRVSCLNTKWNARKFSVFFFFSKFFYRQI